MYSAKKMSQLFGMNNQMTKWDQSHTHIPVFRFCLSIILLEWHQTYSCNSPWESKIRRKGKQYLGVIWKKLWEQLQLWPGQQCWSETQVWKLEVDTSNANIMNVCARNTNSYAPHVQKLLLRNCILSKAVTALPFGELGLKYTPRGNFLKIENKHIHQGWFFGTHFGTTLRLSIPYNGGKWKISTSFRKSKRQLKI